MLSYNGELNWFSSYGNIKTFSNRMFSLTLVTAESVMCDVIKISLKKKMDNRRIFMTSQLTLFPGPLPWLNSENRRDGSSLGLQVSQQSRPSIQHTQTNTHSLCQRQLIVPNKKWRHTLKMTNNYRPVYILPSVNINDNWPIISHLYCMTSFIYQAL